jgi:phosphate/sulfate permease
MRRLLTTNIGEKMTDSKETLAAVAVKATPPVTVSIASVFGYPVSDVLIWATLIYTLLLIIQKIYQIYKEVKD